jgi:hypothetical protein
VRGVPAIPNAGKGNGYVLTNFDSIVNWSGLFYDGVEIGHIKSRRRLYEFLLGEHLATHRQMAFVSGPRQVGKTTTCRSLADFYLNWDNQEDR